MQRFSTTTVKQFEYLVGALIGQGHAVEKVGRLRKVGRTDAPVEIIQEYARRLHIAVTIGDV